MELENKTLVGKKNKDYVPKYSLSIFYLRKILTKEEFNSLMNKYIHIKIANWGKYKGREKTKEKK